MTYLIVYSKDVKNNTVQVLVTCPSWLLGSQGLCQSTSLQASFLAFLRTKHEETSSISCPWLGLHGEV